MNIVTELVFYNKIKKLIKKIKISQAEEYYDTTVNVVDKSSLESARDALKDASEVSIAYRYFKDHYFSLTMLINKVLYTFSDDTFISKENLTTFIKNYLLKADIKIYLYNLKHFIKPLSNDLTLDEIKSLNKKVYDVQLLDYIINLNKDNHLFDEHNQYSQKVKIILDKVHKTTSAHYYIPRHILHKVMIFESAFLYYYGIIFEKIHIKLEQETLLKRMQLFSFVLSDIEKETLKIDINNMNAQTSGEKQTNSFLSKISAYCDKNDTNLFPISYKHNNSITGRLTANNINKINLLSIPKNKTREIIVPEFDEFISMDINGMEVFYFIKNYTKMLDNVEITNSFDIYNYIKNDLSLEESRSLIKNTLIKLLYGSTSFDMEEVLIKQLILENYPELDVKERIGSDMPDYIQTKFKRIIHINNNYNKLLNNFNQSESNDLMINNITLLWYNIRKFKLRSKIKMLIHDQIIIDCVEDEVDTIKSLLNKIITNLPFEITTSKTFNLK